VYFTFKGHGTVLVYSSKRLSPRNNENIHSMHNTAQLHTHTTTAPPSPLGIIFLHIHNLLILLGCLGTSSIGARRRGISILLLDF
jgi:hypothetical protein